MCCKREAIKTLICQENFLAQGDMYLFGWYSMHEPLISIDWKHAICYRYLFLSVKGTKGP